MSHRETQISQYSYLDTLAFSVRVRYPKISSQMFSGIAGNVSTSIAEWWIKTVVDLLIRYVNGIRILCKM